MFFKQIGCVLASAATPVAQWLKFSRAEMVPRSVRVGRVLATAALFAAPAMMSPAHSAGFSIADVPGCSGWQWNNSTSTLTCVPATQTPGAPSGCSLTATPSSITAATNVTLNASCSSNVDSNTTWAWTGAGAAPATTPGASTSQIVQGVAATTTFTATASNATGAGPTLSKTVTLGSGGGGGGAGGGGGSIPNCNGYTSTIKMTFNYVPGSGQIVQTSQGMSPTDIMVVSFTTPANIAGGTGAGATLGITDNAQNSSGFVGSFSTTPCTFTSKVKAGLLSASWSLSLLPNTTYYLNITGDSPLSVKLYLK